MQDTERSIPALAGLSGTGKRGDARLIDRVLLGRILARGGQNRDRTRSDRRFSGSELSSPM